MLVLSSNIEALPSSDIHHHEINSNEQASHIKGPHGGKLLKDGDISVEVTIYEKGMPPHFRIYPYKNGHLLTNIKPNSFHITLSRFNGNTDKITFSKAGDFLQSHQVIYDPHSFDVDISWLYNNQTHKWSYENHEWRVTLPKAVIQSSGIKISKATPKTFNLTLPVTGTINVDLYKLIPVYASHPSIVKKLYTQLDYKVKKGDPLATIHRHVDLQSYTIYAPITGIIYKNNIRVGEILTKPDPIFEIANLETVWCDLKLFPKQAKVAKIGMTANVEDTDNQIKGSGKISYISPTNIRSNQVTIARVDLNNPNNLWRPGMYVHANIIVSRKTAPVAVPLSAIQRWRNWDVVFLNKGSTFEAAPVELGEISNGWAEIKSGLKNGQAYVSQNSYFLKADLGKSGATHGH